MSADATKCGEECTDPKKTRSMQGAPEQYRGVGMGPVMSLSHLCPTQVTAAVWGGMEDHIGHQLHHAGGTPIEQLQELVHLWVGLRGAGRDGGSVRHPVTTPFDPRPPDCTRKPCNVYPGCNLAEGDEPKSTTKSHTVPCSGLTFEMARFQSADDTQPKFCSRKSHQWLVAMTGHC